jgi:hypothetical protein
MWGGEKSLTPARNWTPAIQPIAHHYIDWADICTNLLLGFNVKQKNFQCDEIMLGYRYTGCLLMDFHCNNKTVHLFSTAYLFTIWTWTSTLLTRHLCWYFVSQGIKTGIHKSLCCPGSIVILWLILICTKDFNCWETSYTILSTKWFMFINIYSSNFDDTLQGQ